MNCGYAEYPDPGTCSCNKANDDVPMPREERIAYVGHLREIFMKAADISDHAVLSFLAQNQGRWSTHGEGYSMPTVQDAMPAGTPYKVQLAKMKQLLRRDLVEGCGCGCRGDWVIAEKGLALIGAKEGCKHGHGGGQCSECWDEPIARST